MANPATKRKIDAENRMYQERWENNYFIANNNGKLQCLVCMQVVSVPKEYNVKRHYSTMHEEKYRKYEGQSRVVLIQDLKKKLKQQTSMFHKVANTNTLALHASYAVSLEIAKAKKPFSDGSLVKRCAVEMAKAFGDTKMAEKFESVPLSHQTVQRRVADIGEQVALTLSGIIQSTSHFSLCLDESTDQTDVSQLLIFVRVTEEDFSTKEELLDLCSLHGTTKGCDIYDAVKKSVDKIGGFDKCSAIVTDGAPAMTGKRNGFVGLLRESGVNCPTFHCIIHQEALCGKSVKQNEVMKTVIKVINLIRGGNRALVHRQFKQFLEEMESEYGDLLLYNQVRWLSAGKSLERFFGLRKDIPEFLNQFVSSDTADLENLLRSSKFLQQLAFLTDITGYLNELNLKLQGKDQLVSDLVSHINGFRSKLNLFFTALELNDLTHFRCCRQLTEEFTDEALDFSEFSINIQDIIAEFKTRFQDFDGMKDSILLFNNPLGAAIQEQPANLQLELCDLQADAFLQTKTEKGPAFFKLLSNQRFPHLCNFGRKMTSIFGTTYLCESVFSTMKLVKNRYRSSLTDSSLLHLLRLATTGIDVDISALVNTSNRPHLSH